MKQKYSASKGASPRSASAITGQKAGEAILRNLNNRTRIRDADLAKWLLDNSTPQNPDEKLREFLELLERYYDGKFDDFALVTTVLARSESDPENVSGEYDEFLRRHRDRINGEVRSLTADWYPDRQEEFRRRVELRLDATLTWYSGTVGLKLSETRSAWEKAKAAAGESAPAAENTRPIGARRGRRPDPANVWIARMVKKAGRLDSENLAVICAEIDSRLDRPGPFKGNTWMEWMETDPDGARRSLRIEHVSEPGIDFEKNTLAQEQEFRKTAAMQVKLQASSEAASENLTEGSGARSEVIPARSSPETDPSLTWEKVCIRLLSGEMIQMLIDGKAQQPQTYADVGLADRRKHHGYTKSGKLLLEMAGTSDGAIGWDIRGRTAQKKVVQCLRKILKKCLISLLPETALREDPIPCSRGFYRPRFKIINTESTPDREESEATDSFNRP